MSFKENYEILGELGQGAMGVVYKGRHRELERLVAIKCMQAETKTNVALQKRFFREAKYLAALSHPNVLIVYELIKEEKLFVIVEEYLTGKSLDELYPDTCENWQEAARICKEIAAGLSAVHERDIIHRDLKLANVIITHEKVAKIIDFGLASALAHETALTKTGCIVGTPMYMAPEQIMGECTKSSDVYSLGVILYRLLSGKIPHDGPSVDILLTQRLELSAEPISEVSSLSLPGELCKLIERMLSADPSLRPTANEVETILGKELQSTTQKIEKIKKSTAGKEKRFEDKIESQVERKNSNYVFLLCLPIILFLIFSAWPTPKKEVPLSREAITGHIIELGYDKSLLCLQTTKEGRLEVIVKAKETKEDHSDFRLDKKGNEWRLVISSLQPDCEYVVDTILVVNGRKASQSSMSFRTKAFQLSKFIDGATILVKGNGPRPNRILRSGYIDEKGRLLTNISECGFCLFSTEDGALKSHFPKDDGSLFPRVIGNYITTVSLKDYIQVIDCTQKKALWEKTFAMDLAQEYGFTEDVIVVLEWLGGLRAFDLATGKSRWRADDSMMTKPLKQSSSLLFVRTRYLKTRIFDLNTGAEKKVPFFLNGRQNPKRWLLSGNEHICLQEKGEVLLGSLAKEPRLITNIKAKPVDLATSDDAFYVLWSKPWTIEAFTKKSGTLLWRRTLTDVEFEKHAFKSIGNTLVLLVRNKVALFFNNRTGKSLGRLRGRIETTFGAYGHGDYGYFAQYRPPAIYRFPVK